MTSNRYTAALLPLLVGVFGILQAAQAAGTGTLLGWSTLTQIALLLVGTGVVYWLPLVDSRWRGAAKTGAAVVFAAVSAAVAIIPDGHITKANLILVLTAIVNAVATELGVHFRTDAAKAVDALKSAEAVVAPAYVTVVAPSADPSGVADELLAKLTPPTPATTSTSDEPSTFEEAVALTNTDEGPQHRAE